jgi:hypothetical protein
MRKKVMNNKQLGRRIKGLELTHAQKLSILDMIDRGVGSYAYIGGLFGVSDSRVGKINSDRESILSKTPARAEQ